MLQIAAAQEDAAYVLEADECVANACFFLAEFERARSHGEHAMQIYDPQKHSALALLYANDPAANGCCYAAWSAWFLGYPDQAMALARRTRALADQLGHLYTQALIVCQLGWLHVFRRDSAVALEQEQGAIALSMEHGFPFWTLAAHPALGWALAQQGQIAEGIKTIRAGLDGLRALGARGGETLYVSVLADTYAHAGQIAEGLEAVREGLAIAEASGQRVLDAELHRLRGELLCQQAASTRSKGQDSVLADAERSFQTGLGIARRQSAKSLELRAATSLSRLWHQQNKPEPARELLGGLVSWFHEGSDTYDRRAATALLQQLRSGRRASRSVSRPVRL